LRKTYQKLRNLYFSFVVEGDWYDLAASAFFGRILFFKNVITPVLQIQNCKLRQDEVPSKHQ